MRAATVLSMVLLGAGAAHAQDWPGEQRRVHVGLGAGGRGGVMLQRGAPFLLLTSDVHAALDVRLAGHASLRVQLSLAAGWPHAVDGETNLGVRFGLSPRWSLGAAVFGAWGFPSLRGGLEVPLSARFGGKRQHELTLSLRGSVGVFNNSTFVWWDFGRQALAVTVEGAFGYTFFF